MLATLAYENTPDYVKTYSYYTLLTLRVASPFLTPDGAVVIEMPSKNR